MPERNLDFGRIIDRHGTKSLKWDLVGRRGVPKDALPLWVADMDYQTSSYVEDALVKRAKHAIFGYSEPLDDYWPAVAGWMKRRHGWEPKEEWLVRTPGVVFALAMAVKAYTKPSDAVLIQQPVYYPFSMVIRDNNRRVVSSDLRIGENGHYEMDFEDLERKIADNDVHLLFLCSPHNPVGRVWTHEELKQLGEICLKHDVIVASDEIHGDFVFHRHHEVFSTVDPRFEDISLIMTAPSKTFNLASLPLSNIFIANEDLRKRFRHQMDAAGVSQLSVMALDACEAAYTHGDEWYNALMRYIADNIQYVREYTESELPKIKLMPHEGTYLLWLDFRDFDLDPKELDKKVLEEAKLWLDAGDMFGTPGNGFQRLNAACTRPLLEQAMERLKRID